MPRLSDAYAELLSGPAEYCSTLTLVFNNPANLNMLIQMIESYKIVKINSNNSYKLSYCEKPPSITIKLTEIYHRVELK